MTTENKPSLASGLMGIPAMIALIAGGTAYFYDKPLHSMLADKDTALAVFMFGAVGAGIEMLITLRRLLKKSTTRKDHE